MIRKLKIRIADLDAYMNGRGTIGDVVLNAIANDGCFIFERARSDLFKENFLCDVSEIWDAAADLSEKLGWSTYCKVHDTLRAIDSCQNYLERFGNRSISHYFKLISYHHRKLPLVNVLAMHICLYENKETEKRELLQRIKNRIVTTRTINFEVEDIRRQAPAGYYASGKRSLREMCLKFKDRKYTENELKIAWENMLKKKSENVPTSNWEGCLTPEDALLLLFENSSMDEVLLYEDAYFEYIK